MKKIITSIAAIGIMVLSNLNLNAQVSTAFNTGSSGNYVGWSSTQAFPLKVKHESTTYPIEFWTNGYKAMTILSGSSTSGGNVGINTATPTNLLQVSGGDIDVATGTKGYKINGYYFLWNNNDFDNTFVGYQTGISNIGEGVNTFVGYRSGYANTYGVENVFIGNSAGFSNTTGEDNIAIGTLPFQFNETGNHNTVIGDWAGKGTAGNSYNNCTFLGAYSGQRNATAANCTFIGMYSGNHNSTGAENSHFGFSSGMYNATGSYNTTLGYEAGKGVASNDYSYNTFLGNHAGRVNTNGEKNVFVGMNTGYNNSSADYNTLVGYNSGVSLTSGGVNSFFGYQAGYSSTTFGNNTFIGGLAGYANTTGYSNVAVGYSAGYANTTGNTNTFIGNAADANAGTYNNAIAIGNGAVINASNKARIGNTSMTGGVEAYGPYTNLSDGRFKVNITENVKGIDFIKRLRPVSYQFDSRAFDEFVRPGSTQASVDSLGQTIAPTDYTEANSKVRTGFIAQEVEQAALETGFMTDIVYTPTNDRDNYSLAYGGFVVPLVKAVQEQQAQIEGVQAKNDSLKNKLAEAAAERKAATDELQERLTALEDAVKQCCAAPAQNRLEGPDGQNGGVSYTSTATEQAMLLQNAPNPFTTSTSITYYLPEGTQNAELKIYNLLGEELRVFQLSGVGFGKVTLQGGSLDAGNYPYSLTINGTNYQTKTMVLTK